MVVPSLPHAHLILRHTQLALRLVENVLYPIPLSLHIGEASPALVRGEIGQAVFKIPGLILSHHEPALARRPAPTRLPNPDISHPESRPERSFTPLSETDSAVVIFKIRVDKFIDAQAFLFLFLILQPGSFIMFSPL